MPKLIVTSHYLRDAPSAQIENYVRYIGTREGVEKCDRTKELLLATEAQKKFIKQLIRDIPASKEMLEYTDFLLQPTCGNATEFISTVLEQHVDMIGKRENYVDYIANRPRVERIGEHGLFTDAGKAVVLSQVQEEVARHKGAVWTHVISLRREDAERLGYNHADQWQSLLRSKRSMLCRHMKIKSENLRWYAAFHNEGHHPHVHLMVYSAKDNDGFLTEKSIEAMRSELAHDIFRQDFAHIYDEQSRAEMKTKKASKEYIQDLIDDLSKDGHLKEAALNAELEKILLQLSKRLKRTKGKKVYGYLKRDVKNLVDQAVDILGKDERISGLYAECGNWQDEIIKIYQNQGQPMLPISQNPKFKSIKNMVIQEALRLENNVVMNKRENIGGEGDREEVKQLYYVPNTAMSSAVTNLMIQIGRLFEEEHRKVSAKHYGIDRKRRRKLSEKKQAQGHKWDDREPDNTYGHQEVEG